MTTSYTSSVPGLGGPQFRRANDPTVALLPASNCSNLGPSAEATSLSHDGDAPADIPVTSSFSSCCPTYEVHRANADEDYRRCASDCGTDRHLKHCAIGIGGPAHTPSSLASERHSVMERMGEEMRKVAASIQAGVAPGGHGVIHPQPKPRRGVRLAKVHRVNYDRLAMAKDVSQPDAKFREFVRKRGCQVRLRSRAKHARCSPVIGTDYSRRPLIVFAHTPTGGKRTMSRKASDVGHGIGLCSDLHDEQGAIGWKRFAKKYDIDARAIAEELAAEYAAKFCGKERR